MIKQMKKIGDATLYCADCKDVLPLLKDIDACVTDPPYGLSFMGKQWDYDVPGVDIWTQIHDVLKPGAHLLSFFGSRTYHRGAIPIEDAGFEIRDQLMWLYGSGFPKSHNIGKAVDKLQGNEREVVGKNPNSRSAESHKKTVYESGLKDNAVITKGNSEWEGWGTALKPAHEPIVVARKPFKGSVAENVLAHGTGGINIDGCRVGTETTATGRFPANVMHDGSEEVQEIFEDKARYFYCAKASKKDRDEGLDKFSVKQTTGGGGGIGDYLEDVNSTSGKFGSEKAPAKNNHPTVKPTELMRYLCRLVAPKGGVIVDPFMGSGSTGKAAIMSGYKFIGIEMSEEYFEIACARVEAAQKERGLF